MFLHFHYADFGSHLLLEPLCMFLYFRCTEFGSYLSPEPRCHVLEFPLYWFWFISVARTPLWYSCLSTVLVLQPLAGSLPTSTQKNNNRKSTSRLMQLLDWLTEAWPILQGVVSLVIDNSDTFLLARCYKGLYDCGAITRLADGSTTNSSGHFIGNWDAFLLARCRKGLYEWLRSLGIIRSLYSGSQIG